jgi:type II secretory pathway pseudopilin PulG
MRWLNAFSASADYISFDMAGFLLVAFRHSRAPQMKIRFYAKTTSSHAFTIVEAVIGVGIAGIIILGFCFSLSYGFRTLERTRHELRATQIMLEKLEAVRLYTWEQLNDPTFFTNAFTDYYFPSGTISNRGAIYTGTIDITNCPFSTSYSGAMRSAVVRITWSDLGMSHTREMTTLVASNGLQRYTSSLFSN